MKCIVSTSRTMIASSVLSQSGVASWNRSAHHLALNRASANVQGQRNQRQGGAEFPSHDVFQRSYSLTRVSFGTRSGHFCGLRSLIALRRTRVARHSRHLSKSLQSVGCNPSVKTPPPTCNSSGVNGSALHPLSNGRGVIACFAEPWSHTVSRFSTLEVAPCT